MNDPELAVYLGISGDPDENAIIAKVSPAMRATYEQMKLAEEDIKLWQEGVAPKPTGILICGCDGSAHTQSGDAGINV
jgi:hypothetical protein